MATKGWLLLFTIYTFVIVSGAGVVTDLEIERQFVSYMKSFNKTYEIGSDLYWRRLNNFQEALKRINSYNNGLAQYGLTEYSDLSVSEFSQEVLKRDEQKQSPRVKRSVNGKSFEDLPQKVDWRDHGAVTAVKNQKNCGACWAFSTVETVETMHAIKTGVLLELSTQQIIDCARDGNSGCSGGDTCSVMQWMSGNDILLATESQYPLTDQFGTCQKITDLTNIKIYGNFTCNRYIGDEYEMLRLLATHGPLVAAVDALSWQDYLGGIIQYHCEDYTNHAVQIVGYDLTGEVPYYIVRNSWGTDFGLNGYLHIAIGKNLCGLASRVSILDVTA